MTFSASERNNAVPKHLPVPVTVWMLGFVSLLMDVSSKMINALLPLYLSGGLGVSALAIGFIAGLSGAAATLSKFLSGVLADVSRRAKPLAVLGYGPGALSRLIFPWAMSLDQIFLAKAMDRAGKGIRGTPRDALVAAASPPETRGASFGCGSRSMPSAPSWGRSSRSRA
ncbi:MFS transporter [Sulfitobacter sp. 1A13496]|uniref:MFS transporter n=1 Tax=Sulfitobacter sp. 1A13496 TaxID=3368596 RepID=UPI0037460277